MGSLVAPQAPIITIGDMNNLQITARIPENYYYFFLENKDTMEIEVDIPALENQTFKAHIKRLAPYISAETKNFETIITIEGDTRQLRPGMFVYNRFVLDKRQDIYLLPFDVLVAGKELWYIESTDDETVGIARRMDFSPTFNNQEAFQIPAEYKDYTFILEGQHFIREGQMVRILNPAVIASSATEYPHGRESDNSQRSDQL